MDNFNKVFRLILGISFFVFMTALFLGLFDPAEEKGYKNFMICNGPDPISGAPIVKENFTTEDRIFLCGEVTYTRPDHAPIYWYREGYERPIYANPVPEKFSKDKPVFSELKSDEPLVPGRYRVILNSGRVIMVELEFELTDP